MKIGGWKTAVGIAIIELSFGVGMAVSNDLPTWLRVVAVLMFGTGTFIAIRAAIALYKTTNRDRNK